ncbi:hypothetical protein NA644_13100 [Pseudomonas stutzeri]|uniref:Uncharacterized protein n=1 Tax=Stutzerimonas stutzeri TaxID=316 RepID=A0A2N8SQA4_STUST|nr:hypothetical protein [Stutzerimonas stutzeri]MCQ4250247.1 hypothetical protein [Stutzerimonas stutzeri]PNG04674.1 hypothetical protein CXL00_13445 [Stutzerimonas stutzeri]
MKKIILATFAASLFASAGAFSAPKEVQIKNGYNGIDVVGTDINLARQFTIKAITGRSGFIKNNFDATLSANVIAGLTDDATNNRMGVVSGSNKGYTVFTGSSVGGSVSQCGPQVDKTVADLSASLVKEGTLALANANGCGITTTP